MVASAKNHTVSLPPQTNKELAVQPVPSTIQKSLHKGAADDFSKFCKLYEDKLPDLIKVL